MNYGELKTNLKALAFEEDETIEEYEDNDVIPTAINRAISMIANDVIPITKTYEISQDGTDNDIQFYDFSRLVRDFLTFDTHPVRIDDGDVFRNFGEYDIEGNDTLVMPGNVSGTFRIYYKASHTPYVAGASMDSVQIPLKPLVHHLVPLLAAYFVWLDDDPTKAAQYYNMYETEAAQILSVRNTPRGTILEGGI